MSLLQELMALREHYPDGGESETAGWYIVRNEDDKIGAGPFDSKAEARSASKSKQWYKENEYDFVRGYVDEDDKFQELK